MSITYLGAESWRSFSQWAHDLGACTCDLAKTVQVYPPGVVALLLLARYRSEQGLATRIIPPQSADVLNYLERIDFFANVSTHAALTENVAYLQGNRRKHSGMFTELLTPTEHGFPEAKEVIWGFLKRFHIQHTNVYSVFDEVLSNIADHSAPDGGPPAYSCAQVQIYQDKIELAFGDLGVGFRESLARNPDLPRFTSDRDALRAALLERSSRLAHTDRARGGGLRRAVDVVHQFGGTVDILSWQGKAWQVPRFNLPQIKSVSPGFPGTLVRMMIPRPEG